MLGGSRTTPHKSLLVTAQVAGQMLGLLHFQVMEKNEMQTVVAASYWWQLSGEGTAEQCAYGCCSIRAAHSLSPVEAKVEVDGPSCPPGNL